MFAFTQTANCGNMVATKKYGSHDFTPFVGMAAGYRRDFMERWENRYANGRSGGRRTNEPSRNERLMFIALILLAVVTLAVGIVGGQAIADRSRTKEMMATRALTECSDAVNQVNNLSRSGGSDTAGALGKIRANIKAVETMSTMRQSLYGGALAPQSTFNDLYAIIDSYSAKLKNGSSTIDDLTRLGEVLTGLQLLLQDAR